MIEEKIDEIDDKLYYTENDEITINLLYQKVDLLESIIQKKDKIINLMATRVYLNEQEREEMKEYIYTSNKPKDFKSFVKQYFKKQAKEV
ncbi:MAG: hypothetical protein HFH47_01830 [Bacilli bacterium]|nr:hypothetical protein [Bacilli bacterium]